MRSKGFFSHLTFLYSLNVENLQSDVLLLETKSQQYSICTHLYIYIYIYIYKLCLLETLWSPDC